MRLFHNLLKNSKEHVRVSSSERCPTGQRGPRCLLAVTLLVMSLSLSVASETETMATDVVLGNPGNTCTSGRVKVADLAACKMARKEVGAAKRVKNFDTENDSKWPSGCYFCENVQGCTYGTWFNSHPVGKENGRARPFCALPRWSGCDDGGCEGSGGTDVLLVGDSDIDYWPAGKYKRAFPNPANVGVAGWTCGKVDQEIDGFLAQINPKWVVLVCGENDLFTRTVARTFDSFSSIVSKIQNSGARVLYIGTKPEPSTKILHSKYEEYDQKIRDYAAELGSGATSLPLVMVDSYQGFKDLGNPTNLYASDRLHLSSKGYQKWTIWAKRAINKPENSRCTVWQSNKCMSTI